ncbi:thioesterase II family protein [Streptomyces sp. NPDC058316]|uniref:thioesterase II family protein n=1 Tax=unclassified Streptomyces TaxID=2593676 RepID=UPI0036E6EA87
MTAHPTASPDVSSPWIRRFAPYGGPPPSRARLVCFPHAGGAASYYFPLSRQLAPTVETWAVQYPGRQDRRKEPLLTSLSDMADAAFEALRPHVRPPYSFFGHSMGALLAFEVAHRFERLGQDGPVQVFASARRAPSAGGRERVPPRTDAEVLADIKRLGGTAPGALDDEGLRAMILPVIRADYRAVETYVCETGRTLRCPLTVLVGDDDPMVTVAEAAQWRAHSTGAFALSVYPGSHFYLADQLADVARDISASLTAAVHAGPLPAEAQPRVRRG